MIQAEDPILRRVVAFVEKQVPPPRLTKVSGETDLRNDLRMVWEDAETFADKFFKEFQVDPGDFDISRYFPSEGSLLTSLVGGLFRRGAPPPQRLTVGMFAQSVRDGVWNSEEMTPCK